MSDATEIFKTIPNIDYSEVPPTLNPAEFSKLVHARRSVRVFDGSAIPDDVVNECIDLALLAPNSSNLQPWKFIRVKSPDIKEKIVKICFSQPAARTAAELIVCVACTTTWSENCARMLGAFDEIQRHTGKPIPDGARQYYTKLAPLVYTLGPFGVFGFFKRIYAYFAGFFQLTPREPFSSKEMKVWATKSTALACENLMLAFMSYGYDTCPMEGFDSKKAENVLGLGKGESITMIISAGKRAKNGIYGPRIRFARSYFVKEI